jgi:XTP/dITP diphosphohydrolase
MEIYVATNNMHKVEELSAILAACTLRLPQDAGIAFSHEETGHTYLDNALGKAQALYRKLGRPVLSDDSGLSVPALDGEPGVYSARYGSAPGSPPLETADRNRYLLSRMEGVSDRRAFFVCCMVLMLDEYRLFTVQETFPGTIASAPSGSGGFGYDPLFYLDAYAKSVAELPEEEKNRISHRGRAGKRMAAIIDTLNREKG